jgi:hypothetical protein
MTILYYSNEGTVLKSPLRDTVQPSSDSEGNTFSSRFTEGLLRPVIDCRAEVVPKYSLTHNS